MGILRQWKRCWCVASSGAFSVELSRNSQAAEESQIDEAFERSAGAMQGGQMAYDQEQKSRENREESQEFAQKMATMSMAG